MNVYYANNHVLNAQLHPIIVLLAWMASSLPIINVYNLVLKDFLRTLSLKDVNGATQPVQLVLVLIWMNVFLVQLIIIYISQQILVRLYVLMATLRIQSTGNAICVILLAILAHQKLFAYHANLDFIWLKIIVSINVLMVFFQILILINVVHAICSVHLVLVL